MIYKLIYKHYPINYWLLVILLIVLNFFYFTTANNDNVLSINLLSEYNYDFKILPTINLLIKASFVLISSFIIVNISKVFHENFSITLPSIVFILFCNIIPLTQVNTVIIFLFPLIIFLVYSLFKAYEQAFIYKLLFNFGFTIGFLSVVNSIFILILPILFIWLLYFRQFNIKEYLLPIVSFIVPYYIIDAVYFIITNNENYTIFNAKHFLFSFDKSFKPYFSIVILILILLFSLVQIIYIKSHLKKIKQRRYHYWMLVSLIYLWIVFFLTFNQVILLTIILFMGITTSITAISFNKTLYSSLFIISMFLINIISILINI